MAAALPRHGRPEIINTDQGSQFTSPDLSSVLLKATGHTDMRKGFASLLLQVQEVLKRVGWCEDNRYSTRLLDGSSENASILSSADPTASDRPHRRGRRNSAPEGQGRTG